VRGKFHSCQKKLVVWFRSTEKHIEALVSVYISVLQVLAYSCWALLAQFSMAWPKLQQQQQQQQQHSLFSQASWGRLEMKPERNKFKVQAH